MPAYAMARSIIRENAKAMADKPDCKDEMEGLIEVADELEAKIIDLKAEIKDKASGKTSVAAPAVKTADAPTKPAQYTGKGKGKARANPVSNLLPFLWVPGTGCSVRNRYPTSHVLQDHMGSDLCLHVMPATCSRDSPWVGARWERTAAALLLDLAARPRLLRVTCSRSRRGRTNTPPQTTLRRWLRNVPSSSQWRHPAAAHNHTETHLTRTHPHTHTYARFSKCTVNRVI